MKRRSFLAAAGGFSYPAASGWLDRLSLQPSSAATRVDDGYRRQDLFDYRHFAPPMRKHRHHAGLHLESLEQRRPLAADVGLPILAAAAANQFDTVVANFAPPTAGQTSGSLLVSRLLTDGSGIALTGTNLGSGQLFYSTNNGTDWQQVGAVSPTSALLLAADDNTRLFFLPGPDTPLSLQDAITFKAWSGGTGWTNGQQGVDTLLKPSQTVGLVPTTDASVATAVAPNGQFAVTADRSGGISIIDLTSPGDEPLARLAIPGAAVGVAISADSSTAYIAGDYAGLQIVDLTTPSQPQLTASVATTGFRPRLCQEPSTRRLCLERRGFCNWTIRLYRNSCHWTRHC
jgi:hypothetical protein